MKKRRSLSLSLLLFLFPLILRLSLPSLPASDHTLAPSPATPQHGSEEVLFAQTNGADPHDNDCVLPGLHLTDYPNDEDEEKEGTRLGYDASARDTLLPHAILRHASASISRVLIF